MTSSLPDNKENLNEELPEEVAVPETIIIDNDPIDGDPEEPGKTETLSHAPDNREIDKLIGRDLKHPPVEDNGQW